MARISSLLEYLGVCITPWWLHVPPPSIYFYVASRPIANVQLALSEQAEFAFLMKSRLSSHQGIFMRLLEMPMFRRLYTGLIQGHPGIGFLVLHGPSVHAAARLSNNLHCSPPCHHLDQTQIGVCIDDITIQTILYTH